MSGIQNLIKAIVHDPSFKVDGLVSRSDIKDYIPASAMKGSKPPQFPGKKGS